MQLIRYPLAPQQLNRAGSERLHLRIPHSPEKAAQAHSQLRWGGVDFRSAKPTTPTEGGAGFSVDVCYLTTPPM